MKTESMTASEFSKLVYCGCLPKENYVNDLKQIKYFSYDDFGCHFYGSKEYNDSLVFVVCYDEEHIYGVTKFAYFSNEEHYSISYCSTNKNYLNKGICSKMVDLFTSYFSQYSVSGWKYLRPLLLNLCKQKDISFRDNIIGYMDDDAKYSDEYYTLRDISIKIVGERFY